VVPPFRQLFVNAMMRRALRFQRDRTVNSTPTSATDWFVARQAYLGSARELRDRPTDRMRAARHDPEHRTKDRDPDDTRRDALVPALAVASAQRPLTRLQGLHFHLPR
jgi:hypothetical protein